MDAFVGKWHLTETENFENYMKQLGVGVITRKLASNSKPTQEITVTDGVTHIKTITTFKTTDLKFKLDEEFEEISPDEQTCKAIVKKVSDTKFVHTQKRAKGDNVVTRELIDGKYVMTLEFDKVVSTRKYERI